MRCGTGSFTFDNWIAFGAILNLMLNNFKENFQDSFVYYMPLRADSAHTMLLTGLLVTSQKKKKKTNTVLDRDKKKIM